MINAWLGHFQTIVIFIIAMFVIYMILRIISAVEIQKSKEIEEEQKSQPIRKPQKKLINVEITSRDLIIKAQNLIDQSEVYGLQIEQCVREIAEIECKLEEARNPIPELTHNEKLDLSNPVVKELVNQSLRLQERKAKLEEKLIKIHTGLDKIAEEELKRQMA